MFQNTVKKNSDQCIAKDTQADKHPGGSQVRLVPRHFSHPFGCYLVLFDP